MGKMLSYIGILGTIFVATDENMKKEISTMVSTLKKTSNGISNNMNIINKTINDLANSYRISFNLGENKFSFNDLYIYFSNKVSSVWNSGEVIKVVFSMIMFVLGVISLVVSRAGKNVWEYLFGNSSLAGWSDV